MVNHASAIWHADCLYLFTAVALHQLPWPLLRGTHSAPSPLRPYPPLQTHDLVYVAFTSTGSQYIFPSKSKNSSSRCGRVRIRTCYTLFLCRPANANRHPLEIINSRTVFFGRFLWEIAIFVILLPSIDWFDIAKVHVCGKSTKQNGKYFLFCGNISPNVA